MVSGSARSWEKYSYENIVFTKCRSSPAYLILAQRITVPLFFLTAGLMLIHPCAGQGGTWTVTGSLAKARELQTATNAAQW